MLLWDSCSSLLSCLSSFSLYILKIEWLFPLTHDFSLLVNPKKDSENTPVKGGTVADLGKETICKCFLLTMSEPWILLSLLQIVASLWCVYYCLLTVIFDFLIMMCCLCSLWPQADSAWHFLTDQQKPDNILFWLENSFHLSFREKILIKVWFSMALQMFALLEVEEYSQYSSCVSLELHIEFQASLG